MRRAWHLAINNRTIDSFNTYEQAVRLALAYYNSSGTRADDKFEITHMSVVVWGPYIAGGKYRPIANLAGQ